MRLCALVLTACAAGVWWHPLDRPAQTVVLLLAAVSFLALRSAWKRLDRVHKTVTEAQEMLRELRGQQLEGLEEITGRVDGLAGMLARRTEGRQ
jgi:membrane protein implicated in regulation of membrane protease activity